MRPREVRDDSVLLCIGYGEGGPPLRQADRKRRQAGAVSQPSFTQISAGRGGSRRPLRLPSGGSHCVDCQASPACLILWDRLYFLVSGAYGFFLFLFCREERGSGSFFPPYQF